MRAPFCLTLATTSLFVISSPAAHAQALAPSTLHLTGPDQETKKDIVQAITKEPAQAIAKEPARATTKKSMRAITKEPMPALAKEPVRAIAKEPVQAVTKKPIKAITQKAAQPIPKDSARTFAIEPVRPMDQQSTSTPRQSAFHFSFKTPEGKKESAPVVTQYYPQRIVYPFAGVIDSRPKSELARDAAQELVSNYGFKKLSVSDPFAAPIGSVLVYGTTRSVGHVELRTRNGFVSDFRSPTPSRRPLVGVYAKL